MKYWDKQAIAEMELKHKIHLINSVTGIKPANLISTIGSVGSNVAIFSSVLHLGSAPPLIGFVLRPSDGFERHTFENIHATGRYNINSVQQEFLDKAHMTSVKFPREVSEFSAVGLQEEFKEGWDIPFVKGSAIQLGLSFRDAIDIPLNKTKLVIGEIERIYVAESGVDSECRLDLSELNAAGISGFNGYYSFKREAEFTQPEIEAWPQNLL